MARLAASRAFGIDLVERSDFRRQEGRRMGASLATASKSKARNGCSVRRKDIQIERRESFKCASRKAAAVTSI